MDYVIGIDIGGTAIKYALFDSSGRLHHNDSISTKTNGEAIIEDLVSIIQIYQSEYNIAGAGISIPGTPDEHGNMILGGAVKDFYNYPLQKTLEERVKLTFTIENDANCVALAEQWVGNGKDRKDYLCITFGTGVGGALILNNELYRGYQNMAGEFGLMIIKDLQEGQDSIYSSLNYYGSIPYGLIRLYSNYAQRKAENGIEVYALKNQQDKEAQKAVQEYLRAISIGLLNLAAVLNPQAILLGGSISRNEQFISDIQEEFKLLWQSHSHARIREQPEILPCACAALAGCYGAAFQILCKLQASKAI